jgi:hypothetical protein
VVFEEFEKGVKGVAKYIADRVKEQYLFYLGLLISLTAGVVIDIVLEGFKIASLTTLFFASLALFAIMTAIIGHTVNITLIFDVKSARDWRDIIESVLNLKGTRLCRNARTYNFYLKEPLYLNKWAQIRSSSSQCLNLKQHYNGRFCLELHESGV